ncbi:MAG: O-methyltransferase [uncultured Rubrobacteraceae bacterium]|uniref:O-methyltransferase n=1 Tax=uncultured Rubrobacteraceae bacterium TaxID=349277 RepID=A0A6J4QNG1_9ACTN|nr:MAG: O-methyltransferase [uncultured Rubrobacteraceae bacterium]
MRDNPKDRLTQIDLYIERLFAPPDPALEKALRRSQEAGLPEINVSPNEGRLLQLLAEITGVRRILEIGTLGGYSTIHLARALPEDGMMITLELNEAYARVARENIAHAGLEERVEVRVGDAKAMLAGMVEEGAEPFDLTFIDADKESYTEYLERSLLLARPGSLILADNAIRGGSVIEPEDGSARATHEFNESLANDPRLSALILPLIRGGMDGLAVARVL